MRDFRDAKVMARALRDALKAKAIEITHAEALELIAKAFGYKNWNILSAKIEAAEPKLSDERSLSASGSARPPKRRTRTRGVHWERADPSQITRDYIPHPVRLAVNDIGYEQRGFHWDKANRCSVVQLLDKPLARRLHCRSGMRSPTNLSLTNSVKL